MTKDRLTAENEPETTGEQPESNWERFGYSVAENREVHC